MTTTKSSKMSKALEILLAVYGDSTVDNKEVRKICIQRFVKELKMEKTTASTYLAHVQAHVMNEQREEALKKAEAGKPVFSTYRTGRGNKADIASLAGVFLTKKRATEVNTLLRLPKANIFKGVVNKGDKVAVAAA